LDKKMMDWCLCAGQLHIADDNVLAPLISRVPFEQIEKDALGLSVLSIKQKMQNLSRQADIECAY